MTLFNPVMPVVRGPSAAALKKMNETQEQIQLVRWMRSIPRDLIGRFTASLGETGCTRKKAANNFLKGYEAGTPDVLVFTPSKPYHGLAIELKRTHKPSAVSIRQQNFIQSLVNHGYYARVAFGYWQARVLIEAYVLGRPYPLDADISQIALQKTPKI